MFKVSDKKVDRLISKLITFKIYSTCSLITTFYFAHVEDFGTCLDGIYIIIDNNYKLVIKFQPVKGYLNEPIKADELIKLTNLPIQ